MNFYKIAFSLNEGETRKKSDVEAIAQFNTQEWN